LEGIEGPCVSITHSSQEKKAREKKKRYGRKKLNIKVSGREGETKL